MTTKPLVIYHADCADGFGAAFAAWLKLGDEAEYLSMRYGRDTSPDMMAEKVRGREVYILDFSFEKLVMEHIFKAAKCVVWLDHHKSSFEMWCEGFEKGDRFEAGPLPSGQYILLDDNKSGAYLAWEYFHPSTEVPMFIRHIDDYDRWQFQINGTKEFNKALWSYAPWNFEQWRHEWDSTWGYESTDGLEGMSTFIREGAAILRAHNQNVQAVVRDAAMNCAIPFDEDDCPEGIKPRLGWDTGGFWKLGGRAANCPPHLASDVGHELAVQSGTYGLTWHLQSDGKVKCSLRSANDYDVQVIAKALGGGGHARASGFVTDLKILMSWLGRS